MGLKEAQSFFVYFILSGIVALSAVFFIFGTKSFAASETAASETADFGSTQKVVVSVFVRDDCKHCKDEKVFFQESPSDDLILDYYNLSDESNQKLFKAVAEEYNFS